MIKKKKKKKKRFCCNFEASVYCFNRFLKECDYPDDWKNSNVVPLQKKGYANLPTNYRPISLLSCIGKIMERMVFKHLYNFLHENNLIYISMSQASCQVILRLIN